MADLRPEAAPGADKVTAWWEGPMFGFDLETTDKIPETARIVSRCVVDLGEPGRPPTVHSRLVNPGVPIPAEASEIHGITDEQAAAGCSPEVNVAETVALLLEAQEVQAPVVGMNLAYDYTVLDREARRVGTPGGLARYPLAGGPLVDIYVLDKQIDPYRRGGRKLTDLCAHYGVQHDGAHNAILDVLASMRVAWKIGRLGKASYIDLDKWYRQRRESYHPARRSGSTPYLGQMQRLKQIGSMTAADLHNAQVQWRYAQALSLQTHLRKKDPQAKCNPHWPVYPMEEDDNGC